MTKKKINSNYTKSTSIFCFMYILSFSLLFSCQGNNSISSHTDGTEKEYEKPLTEEELREQLHRTECEDGISYIEGKLEYTPIYKNLFSMKVTGLKLTFELQNHASLATFKDIEIKLHFLSKTGSKILTKNITIYEFIKPGKSITERQEIECSNQQYLDMSEVSWNVVDVGCH